MPSWRSSWSTRTPFTISPSSPAAPPAARPFRPKEDLENFKSYAELFEDIVVSLGGRVSEKLFLDDIRPKPGDIQQATNLARAMVTQFGMSDRLGPISYDSSGHSIFIGRDPARRRAIPKRPPPSSTRRSSASSTRPAPRPRALLTEHADIIKGLADYLLGYESMEGEDF